MSKTCTKPRLWGEWIAQFYGSGTTIVVLHEFQYKPHLYVYADKGIDDDRTQSDRMRMCDEIAAYMNGGVRPEWLDDFMRVSEWELKSLAGATITATGPMFDAEPPRLIWHEDASQECADDRARLIDALWLKRSN